LDPVLLHLRSNHFPIVLGLLGTAALVVALITRRTLWLRYAQITLILAGISAPVAFFTGREAEEHTEHTWYIDRHEVHDHEEAGEKATILLVITGIIAAISVWKDKKALQIVLLLAALGSSALVTFAGLEGGKVVHENAKLEAGH
jgi:uncharacterized membrane protein